jgi:hypothetical protein
MALRIDRTSPGASESNSTSLGESLLVTWIVASVATSAVIRTASLARFLIFDRDLENLLKRWPTIYPVAL